jgi:hypothetical protein
MRLFKGLLIASVFACSASLASAQITRQRACVEASGKGDCAKGAGELLQAATPFSVTQGNGINYHGGPVMSGTVNAYFIFYGNWNSTGSNSQSTVNLMNSLFSSNGLNNSGYFRINSTYGSNSANVSGGIVLNGSTTDTRTANLSDTGVRNVVSRAISNGSLPSDTNGIYFVITSSGVNETSGFCTQYCGWHNHASIGGADIKYAFVGNPDRCPSACEAQTVSPNGNSGADGMASIITHEAEETVTDPDLNAWFDTSGAEDADKCAWKFGSLTGTLGNAAFNQTLGGRHWLIQMEWENSRGGGCALTKGGTFFTK